MGLFGKKKNNTQVTVLTEKTVETLDTKKEPEKKVFDYDISTKICVTSAEKLEKTYSLSDTEPDAVYDSYNDLIKDYEVCLRHYSSYFKDYYVYGHCMLPRIYIKKSEVEEQIKSMVAVDVNQDLFVKIVHKNPDYYNGKYYTTNEDFEIYKDYITNERKPMKLDNADGAYFFEINGAKYMTDTPSYWLFLYKEFGFLKEDKLAACN